MAAQQELGIRAQRRSRHDNSDPGRFVADRPDLSQNRIFDYSVEAIGAFLEIEAPFTSKGCPCRKIT
jgi:hypothetical protein